MAPRQQKARRACTTCSLRKTRCDIGTVGVPCTVCQRGQFKCEVEAAQQARPLRPQTSASSITSSSNHARPTPMSVPMSMSVPMPMPMPMSVPMAMPMATPTGQIPSMGGLFADARPPAPNASDATSRPSQNRFAHTMPHYDYLAQITDPALFARSLENPADPDSMSTEGGMKDAQNPNAPLLPPRPILEAFIANYFRYVHPFFPVVDNPAFLSGYKRASAGSAEQTHAFNPLILQAILFSAALVVPSDLIAAAGYESRMQARKTLYSRTKQAYTSEDEFDSRASIPALLLISQYYPSMTEQRHTSYWVHQAISSAQLNGLHRFTKDSPDWKFLSRIWWACVIRDRMVSIGTGKPMHINGFDSDVPLLALEDTREDGDDDETATGKEVFVELAKLCQLMEGVLSLRTSVQAVAEPSVNQIAVCDGALRSWKSNLRPAIDLGQTPSVVDQRGGIVLLYRALLRMLYNASIITLHQPTVDLKGRPIISKATAIAAAQDSAAVIPLILGFDLARYAPSYGVTCTLEPLKVLCTAMQFASNQFEMDTYIGQYRVCMSMLNKLSETHWHAKFYLNLFNAVTFANGGHRGEQIQSAPPSLMRPATDSIQPGSFVGQSMYAGDGPPPLATPSNPMTTQPPSLQASRSDGVFDYSLTNPMLTPNAYDIARNNLTRR